MTRSKNSKHGVYGRCKYLDCDMCYKPWKRKKKIRTITYNFLKFDGMLECSRRQHGGWKISNIGKWYKSLHDPIVAKCRDDYLEWRWLKGKPNIKQYNY